MNTKTFRFSETPFSQLMQKRIHKVLLVSSAYDAFLMEEDGRINEQIFNEYVALNLRYPPQFIQVTSAKTALEVLEKDQIDLVITMLNVDGEGPFALAKEIKNLYPDKPLVVLTPFLREVSIKISNEDISYIDYLFRWLGNSDILLAIIKLIEDKMNADYDIQKVGVQSILLVENSKLFYSRYLPIIYKIVFQQSKEFMSEELNEHQKMLRMRGRPKILLATNYEEAIEYYQKYEANLLGVISDVSYYRDGKKDKKAGIKLAQHIKNKDPYMPVLLQSAELENRAVAKNIKVGFLHKMSSSLTYELRNFIREYFAFGEFVFVNPTTGNEIMRVSDLKELQHKLFQIPDESLIYHLKRNHLSKWLNARALFSIAEFLRYLSLDDFEDLFHARKFIFDTIANYRLNKGRGVIAKFYREKFDEYLNFARIGEGSKGGKARGLAFLDSMVKRNRIFDKYENVLITIPRTVVLATDIFDEFMEENNLYRITLQDISDKEILDAFLSGQIPLRVHKDLYAFLSVVTGPIAIRSSSLLEDSQYQPFAGIYSTYMIPNVKDPRQMMEMLGNAIKSVYASVFFKDSKAYMKATSNVIDEEKMGVVLQEVCGQKHENRFYPTISGVARSINFYPIEPEKSKDGIANIAFGLGKYIVDGGLSLRFSPKFPNKILQLSSAKMALTETQKFFYALDLSPEKFHPCVKDDVNIQKLRIKTAENDNGFKSVVSTYDYQNDMLRDGGIYEGKKLITFANILKYNTFPLAEILREILAVGQKEMSTPIEIEFAVDISPKPDKLSFFYLLQIRPIVENSEDISEDLSKIENENTIINCKQALGNGIIDHIQDIVYVKPEAFDAAKTPEIAQTIGKINDRFIDTKKNYILIGPGRWGTSDPWLGIPVKWPQISAARLIVESGMENYRIDPSQGTHFFQNLTSFNVGYFTVSPYINEGYYDLDYLNSFDAKYEDQYIRHISFPKPLTIKISGKKSMGVLMKMSPDDSPTAE
mgnify:CR=1 FL=1